jgi:hypothetical protein
LKSGQDGTLKDLTGMFLTVSADLALLAAAVLAAAAAFSF